MNIYESDQMNVPRQLALVYSLSNQKEKICLNPHAPCNILKLLANVPVNLFSKLAT